MKSYFSYFSMILLFGGVTGAICLYGDTRFYNIVTTSNQNQQNASPELLFHFLLALVVITSVAKAAGHLFGLLRQPNVMGEVVAGIALGPSLLGLISPELFHFLLPNSLAPILGMISQLGVVIFMFLVGVELDTKLLRRRGYTSIAISHASILAPMFFGSVLSLWVYPRFTAQNIDFSVFAVFMGVALSITAFPVLARILLDLKLTRTPMAALTITCAAVGDVTAWCLLALAVGLAQSNLIAVVETLVWSLLFFAAMLRFGPIWVGKVTDKMAVERNEHFSLTLVMLGILLTAVFTEAIGIHALFGPFLLGALIPKDSILAEKVQKKLEPLTVTLLLPIFFAFTGLRTQMGLVNTTEQWLWCLLIILAASIAKIGGASIAARLSGINWRDSLGVGVLMNTRGLMELIVLNIGLEMNILSPTLFTMMVIMAVVTTLMTGPLFSLVTKKKPWAFTVIEGLRAK